VPTFEQPSVAQKFSAQEFLKALRSAEKNETILPTTRAARKEAHPKAKARNTEKKQSPHAHKDNDEGELN